MSLLHRLFGSKRSSPQGGMTRTLGKQVRDLEAQAEGAPPGTRGTLLNRAGDVCMRAGDHERALEYFRESIDLLLEDEQPEPARGVAKKIIRVHPKTVRTHCTLAWLNLATGQTAGALASLRDYVDAAERQNATDRAGPHILEMARVTTDKAFLQEVGAALKTLGFPREAETVGEWLEAGGSPESQGKPGRLRRYCFKAAVASTVPPQMG